MTENVDNLILEHLRHIRRAVDELRLDMIDIKARMTAVEVTMVQIVKAAEWIESRVVWDAWSVDSI
jgi:hypothetical protein